MSRNIIHCSDSVYTPVLRETETELARQNDLWGEQNHPDGTGLSNDRKEADSARSMADEFARTGELTWRDILNEEFREALAETEDDKLREELIQVAAVALQWVRAIDRRTG